MAIGEDKGNIAAETPMAESGEPMDFAANPKISTCAKVTGIDIV
jgi:hypothetical protein